MKNNNATGNVDKLDDGGVDWWYQPVITDIAGNTTYGDLQVVEIDLLADTAIITYGDNPVWFGDNTCLLYTSPSPRDRQKSRMPSSA